MNHDWRTIRRLEPHPDGQRRWDRAYQLLLEWAAADSAPGRPRPGGPASSDPAKGASDENCHLCARLDSTPGGDANH
jgi:hypothetical protein